MKAHCIDTYLLLPWSRSSAKVKVKYKVTFLKKKMAISGAVVFHKHILFYSEMKNVFGFIWPLN